MLKNHKQTGLSLFWCAVLMALVGFAAMAALFAMRFERNLFAEAWSGLIRTSGAAETLKQAQNVAENGVKSESNVLRKCIVNGNVMYSNVECDEKNSTSKIVAVRDSQGFEAPKAPPVPKDDAAPTMQDKMMEKAL